MRVDNCFPVGTIISMYNQQRHAGQVGDTYSVSEADAAFSLSRAGSGDPTLLQAGDILMRTAHSGDCFSRYAVFRGGARLAVGWWGYDGVGKLSGNVMNDLVTL